MSWEPSAPPWWRDELKHKQENGFKTDYCAFKEKGARFSDHVLEFASFLATC